MYRPPSRQPTFWIPPSLPSLKRRCSFLRSEPRTRSRCLYRLSLGVDRYCHGYNMTLRSSFQTQETTGNPNYQVPTIASSRENPTVFSQNLLPFSTSPHPAPNQASQSCSVIGWERGICLCDFADTPWPWEGYFQFVTWWLTHVLSIQDHTLLVGGFSNSKTKIRS